MNHRSPTKSPRTASLFAPVVERGIAAIGVDEAGRGCLAGPVVAAAAYLSERFERERAGGKTLRDSKALSATRREAAFERLVEARAAGEAVFGVGFASVETINNINILQATMAAMHAALEDLEKEAARLGGEFAEVTSAGAGQAPILIDGNYFRSAAYASRAQTVVGGDGLYDCIAAASIAAKVTRDRWMRDYADKEFPQYGFARHAGYATKAHREAIARHGVCPLHRALFVRNVLAAARG
jgi:ribonuclease HII